MPASPRLRLFAVAVAGACWFAAAACNPDRSTTCTTNCPPLDAAPATTSLVISPSSTTLTVQGGPATTSFTAMLNGQDVTATATWSLGDPAVGTIDKGVLTTKYPLPYGGSVPVNANLNGTLGAAAVVLKYVAPDVVDSSAPANAPTAFGGTATTSGAIAVVYPLAGAMLARNIRQMEIQWRGTPDYAIYRIHVTSPTVDASFYVGAAKACTAAVRCKYKVHDVDWQAVAVSSSGAQASIVISGTASINQPVTSSEPFVVSFSPDDVKGGLYYFSTSQKGILRLPFGSTSALPYAVPQATGSTCQGCHAVSRDGKKVAMTFEGGDGYAGMLDGSDPTNVLIAPDKTQRKFTANFSTFSPDGTQIITNWAGKLSLRDGTTGKLLMDIPPALYGKKEAVMPEWSPDGQSLVFVGVGDDGFIGKEMPAAGFTNVAGDWILGNAGSIMVMPINGGQFGMAREVVPATAMVDYNFYPSWSPDSQWIVFATGSFPGNSPTAALNHVDTTGKLMSYDQDSARLRLVAVAGGVPIELVAATHQANHTSTWPKFAPFVQNQGNLVFFTFSSKFNYGYEVNSPQQPTTIPQLWMSAIDLAKARTELGASDPSYPPFWLPFQDPTQNNHEGIWTTDVVCNNSGDCGAEFTCENHVCNPVKIQ